MDLGTLQLCRQGRIPNHRLQIPAWNSPHSSQNKEPPKPRRYQVLTSFFFCCFFFAFKHAGFHRELVKAETLSLSNLPSLEDAKRGGEKDSGLPPAGIPKSAQSWNFCSCEMKMQENKSPIRGGREWMDLLIPLINEFHLPH